MSRNYNLSTPLVREQADKASQGFQQLPPGKYLMRCAGVTYKVVNDKDAWDLSLIVVPGEPCEHMTTRDTLFFSERALGRVLLCCNAFGLKDSELTNIDPENEKCRNLLVGRLAIVEVDTKKDKNGKDWSNPTYAGYSAAHVGSIDEMKAAREAGANAPSSPAGGAGESDYGVVPF